MENIQININSGRMYLEIKALSASDIELVIQILAKIKQDLLNEAKEKCCGGNELIQIPNPVIEPKVGEMKEIPIKVGKKRGRKKKVLEQYVSMKKPENRGKKIGKISQDILNTINSDNTKSYKFADLAGEISLNKVYSSIYTLIKAGKIKKIDNATYASLDFIETEKNTGETKDQILETADLKSIEFDELEDKILKYLEQNQDTLIDTHKLFFNLKLESKDYKNAYAKIYNLHKRLPQITRYRGDFNKTYVSYGFVKTLPFDVKIIQKPIIKGEMANLWKEVQN